MEQSATSKRSFTKQDNFVSWKVKAKNKDDKDDPNRVKIAAAERDDNGDMVYQRFYHVFREGELESVVKESGGNVLEAGYDLDNWWVVCEA